jgi:hypothetical protein
MAGHGKTGRLYFVVAVDGDAAEIKRWRLNRDQWSARRRDDIELIGVAECVPVLGIQDLEGRPRRPLRADSCAGLQVGPEFFGKLLSAASVSCFITRSRIYCRASARCGNPM